MAVCYDKLWKLLIDKKMKKTELKSAIGISSSTLAKISKEEYIALPVLEKICAVLDCNIEDVMEFKDLDTVKEEINNPK